MSERAAQQLETMKMLIEPDIAKRGHTLSAWEQARANRPDLLIAKCSGCHATVAISPTNAVGTALNSMTCEERQRVYDRLRDIGRIKPSQEQ